MNKLLIALLSFILLVGCAGYVPGHQTYWDVQVKEMCEKDGGVRIFEKLRVTEKDLVFLDKLLDGKIDVPDKSSAHQNSLAYSEFKLTTVHAKGNLLVDRAESIILRRADQVVIARWVVYKRSGGDFPTGLAYDSSFTCPDLNKIVSDMQQLFLLVGDSK